jgi:hypothetical protein
MMMSGFSNFSLLPTFREVALIVSIYVSLLLGVLLNVCLPVGVRQAILAEIRPGFTFVWSCRGLLYLAIAYVLVLAALVFELVVDLIGVYVSSYGFLFTIVLGAARVTVINTGRVLSVAFFHLIEKIWPSDRPISVRLDAVGVPSGAVGVSDDSTGDAYLGPSLSNLVREVGAICRMSLAFGRFTDAHDPATVELATKTIFGLLNDRTKYPDLRYKDMATVLPHAVAWALRPSLEELNVLRDQCSPLNVNRLDIYRGALIEDLPARPLWKRILGWWVGSPRVVAPAVTPPGK